jgi:hypothetical protein
MCVCPLGSADAAGSRCIYVSFSSSCAVVVVVEDSVKGHREEDERIERHVL